MVDFFGKLLDARFTDKPEPAHVIKPLYLTGNAISESAYTDSIQLASIGIGISPTSTEGVKVVTTAAQKGVLVKGAAAQTANLIEVQDNAAAVMVSIEADGTLNLAADFQHSGTNLGVFGTAPTTKQTVVGAKGGNVALTNLLTALANYGLVTDNTT